MSQALAVCTVFLVSIALLAGCLGGAEPEETTTTQPETTLDEAMRTAQSHIMGLPDYGPYGCRDLTLKQSERLSCRSCYLLTYNFACDSKAGIPGYTDDLLVDVTVKEDKVSATEYIKDFVACNLDAECLPGSPVIDTIYSCSGGVCDKRYPDDPASQKCLGDGHHLMMRKRGIGSAYTACMFPNGNECELEDYFSGRCGVDSGNLSVCTGFGAVGVCTLDYTPVCAKLADGSTESWETFSNACVACTTSMRREVVGYVKGVCPTTTTTLKGVGPISSPQEYCEKRGFAYKVRTYEGGLEYGVCIFSAGDECNAEDFLHGRCAPRRDY